MTDMPTTETAPMDQTSTPSRHIAIAGTGRAGTSFLVRYLTALGLDTTLARNPDSTAWNEDANAGFEQELATGVAGLMPYVVKSPWLFASIDQVLARKDIALDAVIIPMRDLVEAAASRAILERQAIHRAAPWMAESDLNWEAWGATPGGILYSLNALDQARLLAVGFHKLLERLVAAEIPVVFLSFPRFTEDAAYLFRVLRPLLPPDIDEARAARVLAELADSAKVRVGDELSGAQPQPQGEVDKIYRYPSAETVDNIALRRELTRLRHEADSRDAILAQTQAEVDELRLERSRMEQEAESLRCQLDTVWRSRSWRLMQPLRAMVTFARRCRASGKPDST